MSNRFCASCGQEHQASALFCPKCGRAAAAVSTTSDYAGFWPRVGASLIDSVVLVLAGTLVISMVGEDMGLIINLALGFVYAAGMESSEKQATLGKMALGLKVTDLQGNRVSFGTASGRYFSKFLSAIILGIGYLMVAFTDKRQGLHDQIAGTLVVRQSTSMGTSTVVS